MAVAHAIAARDIAAAVRTGATTSESRTGHRERILPTGGRGRASRSVRRIPFVVKRIRCVALAAVRLDSAESAGLDWPREA
jgi:hypothetical protein